MKKRWFRLFGMDFLSSRKVVAMNTPQRGAYMQLLILAWDDPDCSLPKNLEQLKAIAGWSQAPESWGSFEPVRACFTAHPTLKNRLYNARLYDEFQYCQHKSDAAKESASVRWKPKGEQPIKFTRPLDGKTRSSKGLEPVGSEVQALADKYFPPVV